MQDDLRVIRESLEAKEAELQAAATQLDTWAKFHRELQKAVEDVKRCFNTHAPVLEQSPHSSRFRELQVCHWRLCFPHVFRTMTGGEV